MTSMPRPLTRPRAALAAACTLAAALALAFAAGCGGGAAEPESRPAAAAAPETGAAATAEAEAPAAAQAEAAQAEDAEAGDDAAAAPAEDAPLNASSRATLGRPAPEPDPIDPRSEWRIDESIPTPPDLAAFEILAKYIRSDGKLAIVYRRDDGALLHRLQGRLGAYTTVEEQFVEEPKPE